MRLLFLLAAVISCTIAGLYDESKEVKILSTSNFSREVFYSNEPHIVQFYSEWCGACVTYSEQFKTFSRHIKQFLPGLQVAVVNCADDANVHLCRENNIAYIPSLKFFAKESELSKDGVFYEGDKFDLKRLQNFIADLYRATNQETVELLPIAAEEGSIKSVVERKGDLIPVNKSQFELHMLDLKSTVKCMFYKEIPLQEVIEKENLSGLKQWIHALRKYGPGTVQMRQIFYLIDEWIQNKNRITADEWLAELDAIQEALDQPLDSEVRWKACAGSQTFLRGYPCGVWTLAHSMTAEAYRKEEKNDTFDAHKEVIEPFRQFITRFFSCQECADNFEKEIRKTQKIENKEDILLWLWRLHNDVNKRLSNSASDDPSFPKRIFPAKEICPDCYNKDGNFDEKQVFLFLKHFYSNIIRETV